MNQLSFFDIEKPKPDGVTLRDKGIRMAIEHAEDLHEGWQGKALEFLEGFVKENRGRKFSGEMVRLTAKGVLEDPPSLRAWGSILLYGARRGWIKQVGWIRVENPLAHRTPAALWEGCL